MTSVAVIMRFSIQLFSLVFNFFKLASHNFKWVLEFLTYYPFYSLRVHHHHHHQLLDHQFQVVSEEEERVEAWHPHEEGEGEDVDCAVCLNNIGEGEEVRVLRCEHVFHRDCLNQWVSLRNFTCPLCRDFMGSGISSIFNDVGGTRDVIFFRFPDTDYHHRDNWWLR